MDVAQVKQEIETQLDGTLVYPSGEGCNFAVTVVGDIFTGLTPVKKQQLVYGCLHQYIADGFFSSHLKRSEAAQVVQRQLPLEYL